MQLVGLRFSDSDRTTTPMPGCSSRMRLAAAMLSEVCVGGMRMPVRTACGACSATACRSSFGSLTDATSSTSPETAGRAAVP